MTHAQAFNLSHRKMASIKKTLAKINFVAPCANFVILLVMLNLEFEFCILQINGQRITQPLGFNDQGIREWDRDEA